ncbi:MAG TPA: lysophospholipid acyltransferase family protein [Candidatus Acidoferrales bacterium]|nr:lysophospholipid acyltransferase family protein [Candidatus Acidoferrales bacterium]
MHAASTATSAGPAARLGELVSYVRSLLFTIPLIYLLTIFWGTLSAFAAIADSSGRLQHRCARFWARCLLAVCGVRVRVHGAEHIPPGSTCVWTANHQSYLDIPVVFARLPADFRIMAKASLFHFPFLGWHLRRSGHMPVERANPARAARSLLAAAAHVRRGTAVFIFPEGGRSPDGQLREFKTGAFLLAIKAEAPVVPVTIHGTFAALPMHSWNVRPGLVDLVLHPPIPTAGMTSHSSDALAAQVRDVIARDLDSNSVSS